MFLGDYPVLMNHGGFFSFFMFFARVSVRSAALVMKPMVAGMKGL